MNKKVWHIRHITTRSLITLVALILTTLVVSCRSEEKRFDLSHPLDGRVSLWHSWTGAQADGFARVLAKFQEIHPTIKVQVTYIPADAMLERYLSAADSGLGPDIFLGSGEWTPELAENQLIVDLSRLIQSDTPFQGEGAADDDPIRRILSRYTPATLDAVRSGDGLYALPQALNVQALLYNNQLLSEAPISLEQLLSQASQGTMVGMGITFEDAFWGVSAFGGRLRNDDGRYILDHGGFANWLNWLKSAREAPGMILDADRAEIKKRFREQDLAIYIGFSDEITDITRPAEEETPEGKEPISETQLGVVPLPIGPIGNPGPFLRVKAFFFNTASSVEQLERAITLADFVTNAEQSLDLMRVGRMVPANTSARVNPRLDPKMAAFVSQARSAVPLPITDSFSEFQRVGNATYRQVLEGLVQPAQAAIDLTQTLNRSSGLELVQETPIDCLDTGLLNILDGATLANQFQEDAVAKGTAASTQNAASTNDGLAQIIASFRADCPSLIVRRTMLTPDEWLDIVRASSSDRLSADLLFGPHIVIPELVDAELIQDITGRVEAGELQQFLPNALDSMRLGERLYGVPYAVDGQAFYYNKQLVADPINTLSDLSRFADVNTSIAIESGFDAGFWGLTAFGNELPLLSTGGNGSELGVSSAHFVLDVQALVNWLTWLRSVQNTPGIEISSDHQALWERFRAGEEAYYVGPSSAWFSLHQKMNSEQLGILKLPAGPEGDGRPLLHTTGFFFNAKASNTQIDLAIKFVQYATNQENQQMLMEQIGHTPVNVGVNTEATDSIAIFAQNANSAIVAPANPLAALLQNTGDKAYADVLEEGLDPTAAVNNMVAQIVKIAEVEPPAPLTDEPFIIQFGALQLDLLNVKSLESTTETPE